MRYTKDATYRESPLYSISYYYFSFLQHLCLELFLILNEVLWVVTILIKNFCWQMLKRGIVHCLKFSKINFYVCEAYATENPLLFLNGRKMSFLKNTPHPALK